MLICPNCRMPLNQEGNTYRCPNGHSFDISRQHYVNLLIRHSSEAGDSAESLASRESFLNNGYYEKLADGLLETVGHYMRAGQAFLDAGCGTGYYLKKLTDNLDLRFYATDIAKKGVAMSARKSPQAVCFVGNVFHLPLADDSLDGLMSVFTPYSSEEFCRVVKPGGYVFAVTPGKRHLYHLKEIVYDQPYYNSEKGYDLKGFELVEKKNITYRMDLASNEDINALWKMMPYYHTTSAAGNARLLSLHQVQCEADFLLEVFRKGEEQ